MNLKTFLKYVEIQTKLASLFPFVFGVIYALYLYGEINILNTALMYISLLSLDMGTTAINNYMDFKKAKLDDYKYNTNVIGKESVSESVALKIIIGLLSITVIGGLLLVKNTSVVVLILGAFSFFVGVFYTYGPLPISRTPLGEIVSGSVMGLLIVFITVYIQNPDIIQVGFKGLDTIKFVEKIYSISSWDIKFIINIDLIKCISILLVALPFVFVISNLMLANNLRDVDVDIKNDRLTLPYYLGKEKALKLFEFLYNMVYVIPYATAILGMSPLIVPLFLTLSRKKVFENINKFKEELNGENKEGCFKYAVINMIVVSKYYILSYVVSYIVYVVATGFNVIIK